MLTQSQLLYFRRLWGCYQDDYLYLCRGRIQLNEAQNGWKMLKGQQQSKLIGKCIDALGNVEFETKLYLSNLNIDNELQCLMEELNYAIYETTSTSSYLQNKVLRGI